VIHLLILDTHGLIYRVLSPKDSHLALSTNMRRDGSNLKGQCSSLIDTKLISTERSFIVHSLNRAKSNFQRYSKGSCWMPWPEFNHMKLLMVAIYNGKLLQP